MIPVYQAEDLQEAQLLKLRLRELGIVATIHNGFLQAGGGDLPRTLRPEVCVRDSEDYQAARSCAAELQRSHRSLPGPAAERTCHRCAEVNPGNDETCWSCGVDLTA